MGHIELAAPVTHIWYFKGVPSRLGYLLDLAPKDLEKVIYFAAYMITSVDEEASPGPALARGQDGGRAQAAREASRRRHRRARQEAREDLAELEAEGAKADAKRKVRDGAEREMRQIRDRAQREIDRLERGVFDRFKNLKVQDLEGDEMLYREMKTASASTSRAAWARGDPEAPRDLRPRGRGRVLREIIATGKGQRKTRALKRLKVVTRSCTPATRRSAWCSTPSRSSRRTCARWCSSTVAASRPPTSTTSTAA
jgi:DNA-directed RNA polymerase subunit beta'